MGVAIRSLRIKHLIGVDLSAGMLEQAHEKGFYAALHQDDIVSFLKTTSIVCDLALAADVLCYLGDLEPVFQAAFTRIHAGGWFVFSVESLLIDPSEGGTGWKRLLHGRHAHSDRYVEAVAQSSGFHVRTMTRRTVRYDGSIAVPGFVFLLERTTQ